MSSKKIDFLRKTTKVIAYFLLVIGIVAIILSITKFISWQFKKDNYTEQYAYSIGKSLFYYKDDRLIHINEITDILGQKKEIDLSMGSDAIVYVENSNPNSCIYFDTDNTFDAFALDATSGIGIIYVLFASFLSFIFATALEEEYVFIMPKALRIFAKIMFLLGIILLIIGIKDLFNVIGGVFITFIGLHFIIIKDIK